MRQDEGMDRQQEFVLRTVEERDIRFIRLWFIRFQFIQLEFIRFQFQHAGINYFTL